MFLGEYQHTLDAKGRVSLPKRFRDELSGTVIVAKGFDRCLYVYGFSEYEEFVKGLAGPGPRSSEHGSCAGSSPQARFPSRSTLQVASFSRRPCASTRV